MKVIIVGGGKVGYYLIKTLLPMHHEIKLIEANEAKCEKIANELNIPVINGDGTKLQDLITADIKNADILVAVTGKDENNLIACQLAKRKFGIKRTIARVINPKNQSVFNALGVDTNLCSTAIIAELIEREIDYDGMKHVSTLKGNRIVLSEVFVSDKSLVKNKTLKEIAMPHGCAVVSIIRGNDVIIPKGDTVLLKDDCVIAVTTKHTRDIIKRLFV
jgi:trk system potassium uptake protein TrkA